MISLARGAAVLAVVVASIVGGASGAKAADTSVPVFESVSFSATSVDVSDGPVTVTVTARITDEGTGFASGYVSASSGTQSAAGSSLQRTSGTPYDGTYTGTITFSPSSAPGQWTPSIVAQDTEQNSASVRALPITVTNSNDADTTAPTVESVSFSTTEIDVSEGPVAVTVTARITDAGSGVASGYVNANLGTQYAAGSPLQRTSGTAADGTYTGTITFSTSSNPGRWIPYVLAEDASSNQASVKALALTVTNSNEADDQAPTVESVTFSATTVDISDGPVAVTVTARIIDEGSGVAGGYVNASSGTRYATGSTLQRTSGTAYDGIYSGTITFSTPGQWIPYLLADDAKQNRSDVTAPLITVTDGPSRPGAPTGVTATGADRTATVSWTASAPNGSAVTAYLVTSSPGGLTATVAGDRTTATVSGLTNGTRYTFSVVATNANGDSAASVPSNPVTPAALPGAPTGVVADGHQGSATVRWTASAANGSPVTRYTITSSPGRITKTVTGEQTAALVTGLTDGVSYTFTVVATSEVGDSPASRPSNAVTPGVEPEVPGAPGGFEAKVRDRTVVLTWHPPFDESGVTGYRITSDRGRDVTVGPGVRKAVFRDLTLGRYTFTIRTLAGDEESAPRRVRVRIR